jgi:tetratricopeptide (TPR) repeat protein
MIEGEKPISAISVSWQFYASVLKRGEIMRQSHYRLPGINPGKSASFWRIHASVLANLWSFRHAYLSPRVRPLACAHLASLSLTQGALEGAEALIEEGRAAARAIGDAPAEGRVVLVLAQLKEQQGDSAGAEQAYTEAVRLLEGDPFQSEARTRSSQWLAAAGRYEEAVHLLQATYPP